MCWKYPPTADRDVLRPADRDAHHQPSIRVLSRFGCRPPRSLTSEPRRPAARKPPDACHRVDRVCCRSGKTHHAGRFTDAQTPRNPPRIVAFIAAGLVLPVGDLCVESTSVANCSAPGPGTQAQPFCTVQAAADVVRRGQTCISQPRNPNGRVVRQVQAGDGRQRRDRRRRDRLADLAVRTVSGSRRTSRSAGSSSRSPTVRRSAWMPAAAAPRSPGTPSSGSRTAASCKINAKPGCPGRRRRRRRQPGNVWNILIDQQPSELITHVSLRPLFHEREAAPSLRTAPTEPFDATIARPWE